MNKHESLLTIALLQELLDYSPVTGEIKWLNHPAKPKSSVAGKIAGSATQRTARPAAEAMQYRKIGIRLPGQPKIRLWIPAHRIAWALHHGEWPGEFIDHIDGDGTNNRINNLRLATRSVNARNQHLHSSNTSGVCGVTWHQRSSKWQAQAGVVNPETGVRNCIHLGLHQTIFDAAAARKSYEGTNGYGPAHGSKMEAAA